MPSAALNKKEKMGFKQKIFSEFKTYWLNVLYITLFLSIFTDYRRLILAHYHIAYEYYGISVIKALILAKVILIAEHLHIGRGFENKPLAIPTLYKSFVFTICVGILNVIEFIIHGFMKAQSLDKVAEVFIKRFSYEWFADTLVIFFLFIPFFAIRELGKVLGKGKITELFFHKNELRGPDLKNPK